MTSSDPMDHEEPITIGDMAFELAEHAYFNMQIQELCDLAWDALQKQYADAATKSPEWTVELWKSMRAEEKTADE